MNTGDTFQFEDMKTILNSFAHLESLSAIKPKQRSFTSLEFHFCFFIYMPFNLHQK